MMNLREIIVSHYIPVLKLEKQIRDKHKIKQPQKANLCGCFWDTIKPKSILFALRDQIEKSGKEREISVVNFRS